MPQPAAEKAPQPALSPAQRQIVVWLRANLRTGPHSPLAIARGTSLKRATVRKELTRLTSGEKEGSVIQTQPGYYRAFMDASELAQFAAPLPALHHIHLHIPLPQNGVTGVGRRASQAVLDSGATSGARYVPENGGLVLPSWFEGRKVTTTIYDDAKLAVVQLQASEAGLNAEEWKRFLAQLRGQFGAWGVDVEAAPVKVAQFDINVDVHALRIEGASAISLRRFSDAFLRAYNKADRLRFEVAAAHPCTPTEITTMLETFYERSTAQPARAPPPALPAHAPPTPADPNDPAVI